MWSPRSFKEQDVAALHDLIRRYSFGVIIDRGPDGLTGTHLPFMVDPDPAPNGTLIGHMARANPQWKGWDEDTEVMVIFRGPHAYISPNWYHDQVTVPTWNYAAVHVYGRPRLIHDVDALLAMTTRLTERHEAAVEGDWSLAKAEPVIPTELQAIVGFEIPIDRMIGKLKFSQNRSREDRAAVADALADSEESTERGTAALMRRQLADENG